MGLADVIPGISGGTIAFITGIYSELIKSINDVGDFLRGSIQKITRNKGSWKQIFTKINFTFFIPLILGIWSAFAVGVLFIPELLQQYPSQIMGLFIGLIIATTALLVFEVKQKNFLVYAVGFIGLLIGFFISQITITTTIPSYLFIFFIGALSICAMILPGISGAYILLMFGQYEFMLNVLRNLTQKYWYFVAFTLGAIIGLLSFSKLLNYLLKKHESKTLMFLAGLMLGAMYGPLKTTTSNLSSDKMLYLVLFVVLGILLVVIIEGIKKRITHTF